MDRASRHSHSTKGNIGQATQSGPNRMTLLERAVGAGTIKAIKVEPIHLVDPITKKDVVLKDSTKLRDWVVAHPDRAFKAIRSMQDASETSSHSQNTTQQAATIPETSSRPQNTMQQAATIPGVTNTTELELFLTEPLALLANATTRSLQRSAQLPDAPKLSDGKEVPWDYWLFMITTKLERNADHFPRPIDRIAYVVSRCEGTAMEHIIPRLRQDSTKPYNSSDDIIDHA